jgi:hypothetical protein
MSASATDVLVDTRLVVGAASEELSSEPGELQLIKAIVLGASVRRDAAIDGDALSMRVAPLA